MGDTQAKIVIKGEDQYSRTFKGAELGLRGIEKTGRAAGDVLKQFLGPLALGAIVYKLQDMATSAIRAGDEIAKLSLRLGASTEALSEYRLVAEKSGVDFKTLTLGWQRMTRRISEAAKGTGEAKDALRELGLDAQKLNQVAPDQQFEALADALLRVEDPADRVRLAMKLFDSEGVALIQTMETGSKGIRELREEAKAAGLSMSGEAAQGAVDYSNAVADLKGEFRGLGEEITQTVAPAITALLRTMKDEFREGKEEADGFIEAIKNPSEELRRVQSIDKQIMDNWKRSLEEFLGVREKVAAPMAASVDWSGLMVPEEQVEAAADAVFRLNTELAKSPVLAKNLEAAFTWEDELDSLLEFGVQLSELHNVSKRVREQIIGAGSVSEAGNDMDRTLASAADSAGYAISSSIGGALANTKQQLIDLGSIGRSVFGSLLGGIIGFGVHAGASALFPGASFLPFLAGARASGGPVAGGSAYLVGERGPELFVPSQSGTVVPSGEPAAAGAATYNISINAGAGGIFTDPMTRRRVAASLVDEIERVKTYRGVKK